MLDGFLRRPRLTVVGAVALVIIIANPAAAPPGDLDPTFDGDGKVTTDFAGSTDGAFGAVLQGDGKIVAAGSAESAGVQDFALARYGSNGSLDPTFDGDGRVMTDFAGTDDEAHGTAIQADGKIVAAGCAPCSGSADFALARYSTDGSLDPAFDGDGKATTNFAGGFDGGESVAIQGDGKLVVAGVAHVSGTFDFALARYNTDGSLDPTFDGDGKVTTDFTGGTDAAKDLTIQGDGKIVTAGIAPVSGAFQFALARYNTDGSLDPTFDGDGKVTTDFAGSTDEAYGVAIQADGKIVAVGRVFTAAIDFGLARYNTDGSLDPTFDGDGKVTTDFAGSTDEAFAVAIQGNGKIVAAGRAVPGTLDFALARYNTDGSLDTTFSGDGKVTTDFSGGGDGALGVLIQGDGKIVAAGQASADFGLARYTVCRRTSRLMSIPSCP